MGTGTGTGTGTGSAGAPRRQREREPVLKEIQEHAERNDIRAIGVADVEVLVLEPPAEVADVHLPADAPREIGTVVREGKEGAAVPGEVGAATRGPARHSDLAEDVEVGHRNRSKTDQQKRSIPPPGQVIANGGDNVAAYIPFFRTSSAGQLTVTIAVFMAGVAVYCLASSRFAAHRAVTDAVQRWGQWAVPVVFITAFEDEGVRDRALRAGAVAFLRKPFEERDLLDAVARALHTTPAGDAPAGEEG